MKFLGGVLVWGVMTALAFAQPGQCTVTGYGTFDCDVVVDGDGLHLAFPHALVANAGMQEHHGQPFPGLRRSKGTTANRNGKSLSDHIASPANTMAQNSKSSRAQQPGFSATGAKPAISVGLWPGLASLAIK